MTSNNKGKKTVKGRFNVDIYLVYNAYIGEYVKNSQKVINGLVREIKAKNE